LLYLLQFRRKNSTFSFSGWLKKCGKCQMPGFHPIPKRTCRRQARFCHFKVLKNGWTEVTFGYATQYCQIFLRKTYQMTIKYTKRTKNIPNAHKICIPKDHIIYQNKIYQKTIKYTK
jgi:hypothetical protein